MYLLALYMFVYTFGSVKFLFLISFCTLLHWWSTKEHTYITYTIHQPTDQFWLSKVSFVIPEAVSPLVSGSDATSENATENASTTVSEAEDLRGELVDFEDPYPCDGAWGVKNHGVSMKFMLNSYIYIRYFLQDRRSFNVNLTGDLDIEIDYLENQMTPHLIGL